MQFYVYYSYISIIEIINLMVLVAYKQRVAGSNPAVPTDQKNLRQT